MTDEKRDVLGSLAQGWNVNREDLEPVVQVASEETLLDEAFKITVRRCNDSSVDADCLRAAQPLNSRPEHAEAWAAAQRQIADFIQEQRSPWASPFGPPCAPLRPERPFSANSLR
jgi:hypothetical protein